MQRTIRLMLLSIITIAALSSCTKDPLDNMTEEESRIYITNRDSTVSFSSYKTYSIADSVTLIDNNMFAVIFPDCFIYFFAKLSEPDISYYLIIAGLDN